MPLAPTGEAIKKAMEVATTPEAAEYLAARFLKKITSLGKELLKQGRPVWENICEWRDNVVLQYSSNGDPWAGKLGVTDFQNLQQNLAQKAAEEISSDVKGNIRMDYAINDSSQLIRGYGAENPEEDEAVKNKIGFFDKLFNAWLAAKNFISQDSTIYEGTEKGEIRRDAKGNPIPADPEKVRELINDSQKGYQKYLKDRGIEAIIQQHDYPAPQPKPVRQAVSPEEERVAPSVTPP
jgi:hypothetical protein